MHRRPFVVVVRASRLLHDDVLEGSITQGLYFVVLHCCCIYTERFTIQPLYILSCVYALARRLGTLNHRASLEVVVV